MVPPGKALVCAPCREAWPFLLSCIHTFEPTRRSSGIGQYDREEDMEALREIHEAFSGHG